VIGTLPLVLATAAALAAGLAAAPASAQQERPQQERPQQERPQQERPQQERPQQERPLMFQVGGSLASDSNPLRQPAARADHVTTLYGGLRVEQAYAQQRFLLDVTSTARRYARLSFLDFDALDYRGLLDWRLGRRLSGTLGTERAQSLADYSEFRDSSRRNVLTLERTFLSVDGWLFGGWHLLGGLQEQQHKYSVPFPQRGNYRAIGSEAGVAYLARSGSSAALKLRRLDGHYLNQPLDSVTQLDDGFKRSEAELSLIWAASARSTVESRIARVDFRANHFARRDFSGTAAALDYRWLPAARLTLSLSASRDLEPWLDQAASYRVVERIGVGATWQFAARTALRLSLARQASDFRNPLPGSAGATRFDVLQSAQLALEWNLYRNVVLTASLQRQRQSSTDPTVQFEARIASLAASARF
jgi:exopolysaccharide biosynthesis operon protein EpsL